MQESGHISIHTENIFPIIKKWLYSEKDIFVRELVANASDAISKLQKLALIEDLGAELPEPKITINVDEKRGVIEISDTGIGMTADEVKKYINQVAFSGVQDFVQKYHDKGEKEQIIGHFGLGFYSSLMVSSRVEIETLSFQKGAQPVHWQCDGSTQFEITKGTREQIGTTITLTIADDSKEMLNAATLREILQKYCHFIRYPIEFEGKVVNEPRPLYTLNASQLTDKDYYDFFHTLFPGSPDPLFWIHLNVDYPFKLKGVLYFPKLQHELDASEGKIKLFCNQVFVSDNAKELIPEFLLLLKGAIDCPDLPLNVSRSYLQNDPQAKKISSHIIKKVADKLTGMAKTEAEQFQKYWDDIHPFIKYGMMRDEGFFDKLQTHVLYKTNLNNFITFDQYFEKYKDKTNGFLIYAHDPDHQASYIKLFADQGIEVILASTLIDRHFLPYTEMKSGLKYKFKRIDADLSDVLVNKEGSSVIVDPKDQKNKGQKVLDLFNKYLTATGVKVKVESLKSEDVPAMILVDENMRRLEEMSRLSGKRGFDMGLGDRTLIVNQNSLAIKNLLRLSEMINKEDDMKLLINQVYDLAYLQHGSFSAENMQEFLKRSVIFLEKLGNVSGSGSASASSIII